MCSPAPYQGKEGEKEYQDITREGGYKMGSACVIHGEKVPLQDVKLCPTWKVNEVKCPDLCFVILLPSYRAGIGFLHTKNNRFDSLRR